MKEKKKGTEKKGKELDEKERKFLPREQALKQFNSAPISSVKFSCNEFSSVNRTSPKNIKLS